jgi:lipopolysaccharide cholinephosphotransferase
MKNKNLEQMRREMLREAQLKMLGILEEIDKLCKTHGISYWIEGGTLLGAMRHGGFIPWDDDVDISMLRPDYERFLEVAAAELPPHLFLQTRKTDPSFHHRECKVRDLNSFIADGGDDTGADYQKGLFVDVFPYDLAPSKFRSQMGNVAHGITIATIVLDGLHHFSWRSMGQLFYFGIKRPLLKAAWRLGCLLWANGEYVAIDPHFSWSRAIHNKSNVFPLGEVDFEGKRFSAPAKPDEYLTTLYGDWHQIPPKEKQQIHSMLILPKLVDNPAADEHTDN